MRTTKHITRIQATTILLASRPCQCCGRWPSNRELAAMYGTSESTVSRLLHGSHQYSRLVNPHVPN